MRVPQPLPERADLAAADRRRPRRALAGGFMRAGLSARAEAAADRLAETEANLRETAQTSPEELGQKLTDDALAFLTERHLAMLTTLRADGSPHVVAVGFTFDPVTHIARVITSDGSQKAINAERNRIGVLSQVDGARWLSLEGIASVNREPDAIRDAELRYAQRYRVPKPNPQRVAIEVIVKRVLGSSTLLDRS